MVEEKILIRPTQTRNRNNTKASALSKSELLFYSHLSIQHEQLYIPRLEISIIHTGSVCAFICVFGYLMGICVFIKGHI